MRASPTDQLMAISMPAKVSDVDPHFAPPRPLSGGFSLDLLFWTGLQAGLIALSAVGVPLSAHFPDPADGVAVETLIVGQTLAIGLTGPRIVRDFRGLIAAAASMWVFLALATRLAGDNFGDSLAVGIWLTSLLFAVWLACWRPVAARNARLSWLFRTAAAGLLLASTLLLPAFRYLHRDFVGPDEDFFARFDLIRCAMNVLTTKSLAFSDVFSLTPLLVLGVAVRLSSTRRYADKLSTVFTHSGIG